MSTTPPEVLIIIMVHGATPNKLTLIDTEEDNYTEVWTVTTMTENELVYELREKEKEDGTTYEYYEQHAFTR